jgi:hypothetical protein
VTKVNLSLHVPGLVLELGVADVAVVLLEKRQLRKKENQFGIQFHLHKFEKGLISPN